MKNALILCNPYLTTQTEFHQLSRIEEELLKLGVTPHRLSNAWLAGVEEEVSFYGKLKCEKFDFCVYLDKDKYVPRMLEKRGMRLFNRAESVELCDDKMLTHIALAGAGIPMPETIPTPLCYKDVDTCAEDGDSPARILGYPLVVKESFGSLGKQVFLARNREELLALRRELKWKPHLFQRYIAESAGQDLRVICVGGEVVACMRRVSENDFRSNIGSGGRGERYPVTEEVRALARKVSETLKLDYCGIDLLFGKEGFLVCEVNSNAYFETLERVTEINVAKAYAEHMCRVIYG